VRADHGRGALGAGGHMMTYSEEAKATAAKVERILKVAKVSFVDAIDFLGCIEILEAGNRPEIIQSREAAKAERAADLIQRALFGHCLMSVMTAFDPVRPGDFHLRVGMTLVAEQIPRMALGEMKGTSLADIEAAERRWAECLNFEHLESLRAYRNKSVAHMSQFPAGMQQPVVRHIFDLAKMTAKVAELLANGTGIAGVSLESQIVPFRESGRAIWEKWKQSD
jgi:AbiU2